MADRTDVEKESRMKNHHLPSNPTMTQLRAEPGEYIRDVSRHGRSFTVTKSGKPVARLVPAQDGATIMSDGTIVGEVPVTFRRNLGGSY